MQLQALLQSTGAVDQANYFGAANSATGYASLSLFDGFGLQQPDFFAYSTCAFQGCAYPSVEAINDSIDLYANVTYVVVEAVRANSSAGDVLANPISLTSTATADPHFAISQSLANSGYSFTTSQGLAPLTSVSPEPGSWILMLAGIGLLGAAFRGRAVRGRTGLR